MEAIILAAGVGSRLAPLTDSVPKSMVCVNNRPILDYQVEGYVNAGVEKICIVSGYKHEKIDEYIALADQKYNITFEVIKNPYYSSTNNMYSLYLALKFSLGKAFFISNADVVLDKEILKIMSKNPTERGIAYEHGNYNAESMKIEVADGRIIHISKSIPVEIAAGTSIDFYKFDAIGGEALYKEIERTIELEKNLNAWTEVAIDSILKRLHFSPINIESLKWVEIDTMEDLRDAERKFH